jgi:hypothetical protein
MSHWTSLTFLT